MMRLKVRKRTFLAGIMGAFFVFPAAAVSQVFSQKSKVAPKSLASMLIGTITDLDSAKAVGACILETKREGGEMAELNRSIGARLKIGSKDLETAVLHYSRKELRSYISAAVREDFSAGRTTEVDGWILSDTECELCVLATISERNVS